MEERTVLGRGAYELGLRLGGLGTVAIGSAGGELARALARCVGCGVALAGGDAHFHDGSCAACAAWLGRYYTLPASVFIRQQGRETALWVTDSRGLPLTPPPVGELAPCTGRWDTLAGADCGWAARRAGRRRRGEVVSARGTPALRLLLERLGCVVLPGPRPGAPAFTSDREGFRLTVEWDGATLTPPGEDALDAAALWLAGA